MNYYVDFVLLTLRPLAFKWHESLIPRIDSYEQYSQIYQAKFWSLIYNQTFKYQIQRPNFGYFYEFSAFNTVIK